MTHDEAGESGISIQVRPPAGNKSSRRVHCSWNGRTVTVLYPLGCLKAQSHRPGMSVPPDPAAGPAAGAQDAAIHQDSAGAPLA